ncbi:UDP-3-O-acyl-N-acetylglucosamine deacetylase [Roseofilum sp. BLCC_M154]|uniref:UDP-3-O-acyl-N-acetylglucosamine deacetylase n=1 Tax=Roseofilum acuticapitatum BLCC-M154 TaxID=3022444 RepID=A0ABT7AZ41_9CYAN|nr:UDP-3-O-acyl-N-acetylglucosamine deacetylase [Roseofilum acuticapitatum]MDJ1172183.1 UDP-3-O-acyl-N-acetylglucosamine deacetylase [Roseofilum acuticapitatum BLCC-M154]
MAIATLTQPFTQSGIGLHSGLETQVKVLPAQPGSGRYFVRVDLPNRPTIPAQIAAVKSTILSTELAVGQASVRTVEHLLASLISLGITDARIEIDGPEIPLLDGSSAPWVEGILDHQPDGRQFPVSEKNLTEPIWITDKDAFVAAIPAPQLRFTYGIEFDLAAIGQQWHTWQPDREPFSTTIAPARTFGLAHQIEHLRAQGLIKGGSLDNALVCGPEGWLNPPLRFANEPARHKLLDLVGDLSLVGVPPVAHYLAFKASHHLHVQLAKKIAQLI